MKIPLDAPKPFDYSLSMGTRHTSRTAFADWLETTGLSYREAAELLGKSEQMIRYLEAGKSPRGQCVPQTDTRRLMMAIARDQDVSPWPV